LKKRIPAGLCIIFFLTPVFAAAATAAGAVEMDLEEAVEMALANPLNLGAAEAGMAEAEAGLDKARAARWPGLSAGGSMTRVSEQPSMIPGVPPSGPNTYSTGLSLNWPLYTGGRVSSGISMAELGLETSRAEYQSRHAQTVYRTLNSYINLLKAAETVELSRRSVEMVEEHLAMVELNYELGAASGTDLLETEIRLSQAKQGAARAEHGKNLAEMNFRNLLGMYEEEKLVLAGVRSIDRDFVFPSQEEATAVALESRTELVTLRNYLALAKENLQSAKGFWKPNVVVVGNYGTDRRSSLEFSDPTWTLSLAVEANLFSGGGNRATIKEREAAVEKAEYTYRQAVEGIKLEIKQKYIGIAEALQTLELAGLTLRQAEENYDFTQARYKLGAAGNLEVLTAQNTLNQCRFEKLAAGYDYFLAAMELYQAMGMIERFLEEVNPNA